MGDPITRTSEKLSSLIHLVSKNESMHSEFKEVKDELARHKEMLQKLTAQLATTTSTATQIETSSPTPSVPPAPPPTPLQVPMPIPSVSPSRTATASINRSFPIAADSTMMTVVQEVLSPPFACSTVDKDGDDRHPLIHLTAEDVDHPLRRSHEIKLFEGEIVLP